MMAAEKNYKVKIQVKNEKITAIVNKIQTAVYFRQTFHFCNIRNEHLLVNLPTIKIFHNKTSHKIKI